MKPEQSKEPQGRLFALRSSRKASRFWVAGFFVLALLSLPLFGQGMPAFATRPALTTCTPGTIPCPGRPLRVSKVLVSPPGGVAVVGEIITFRITIENVGHTAVTRVWAADDYPVNCLAYVSSTPPGADLGDGHIEWQYLIAPPATIPVGGSVQVTVRFRAARVCEAAVNWFVVVGEYRDGMAIPSSSARAIVSIRQALPTATSTATPTETATATATETASATPSATATATDTPTPSPTYTDTPTATASATDTPTSTATSTATPLPTCIYYVPLIFK